MLFDGWVLRFAEGYTKRANSINPLYPSQREQGAMIDACEGIYQSRGLPTIFKLTSDEAPAGLDAALAGRGYRLVDPTLVQTLSLVDHTAPIAEGIVAETALSMRWLSEYTRMNSVAPEKAATLQKMLLSLVPDRRFVMLFRDGQPVGCAMIVLQDRHVGIFDVVIEPTLRRRGLGRCLMQSLLALARDAGAERAYLQVVAANTPAVTLYRSLGFKDIYDYWYRVK
jgi:ribosomal protein S18 acetylase RimI-like enzyme